MDDLKRFHAMQRAAWAELWRIITHGDTQPVALLLCGVSLLWGVVLLLPGTLFGGANAAYYAPMSNLAALLATPLGVLPETVWGGAFCIIGVSKLIGTLLRVQRAWLFTLPNLFLLAVVTLTLFSSSTAVLGPWLHALFTLASLWVHVRTMLDRRWT